jgi:hypothetical protein
MKERFLQNADAEDPASSGPGAGGRHQEVSGPEWQTSADELAARIHDYATACRRELERLELARQESADRFRVAREAVARLQSLAGGLHPLLQEKTRRIVAILRRLGSSPASDNPEHYQLLYRKLAELQESPLWALPIVTRAEVLPASGPVLRADAIFPDRVVFYTLGDLHFLVRGDLKYNLHRADLSREYRVRRNGPVLPIFPHPVRDSQSFPAPAYGGNLMVFAAGEGGAGHLGLRYDRILAIEDFQPAVHEHGVEGLERPHPIIKGRLRKSGESYYVVAL